MMSVKLGSAHGDENGKAYGGAAGDQTGKEISIRNYYNHSKGWRAFRAYDRLARIAIGRAMYEACRNEHIGYDQYQRDSLYKVAEKCNFDISQVTTDCETDCSALVRVCCASAGIMLPNFRTWNEPSVLLQSGQFFEIEPDKVRLMIGDILCTKTSGHTEIVVSADYFATNDDDDKAISIGGEKMDTLRIGSRGYQVKVLQSILSGAHKFELEIDGDFGAHTRNAVKAFQEAAQIKVDGVVGAQTWEYLLKRG